ncbi:AfsR/SARP family transcriptional regulator [Paractinoplanes hotanensis]|uniref:NB-ARC domain-containing protein n=1 Tax=Paractinoplanes hotanensis TaxID=2906497 RepID=A0ABT0YCB7_9ACTN|nr:BTAD domain-containing putative transcriptional regulator [Actinoplanes hotanensis]MCM4083445.1 NB-ARC domain-containing protein [Actinoplanes hotanensis]
MGLSLQVLGPVRALLSGTEVDLGPRQQRLVLALLLARAGKPVGTGEFIELLWDQDPPASAMNLLYRFVGAIRRLLEPSLPPGAQSTLLVGDAAGYRLGVDGQSLDLVAFRDLVEQARTEESAGRPRPALSCLVDALSLWRGPCAGAPELLQRAHPTFVAVDHECADAARRAGELAVRCGEARVVLPVVRAFAAQHPLDEALQAQLMLMLSADGKQAEAIAQYGQTVTRLREDLGASPGAALCRAHEKVLRGTEPDPGHEPPRSFPDEPPHRYAPASTTTPKQLPLDLPVFSGRQDVLRRVLSLVRAHVMTQAAMPILAIDGIPGIGKTTLAIHAAHQLVDSYPDGQLYVDLQGFHPHGNVREPEDVLQGFLNALNIPDAQIPDGSHARSGLFRSVLAGRRVMVVLDNARDLEQVRPLLPGTPGCLVIVTSRNPLGGLAVAYGAHMNTLDALSPDEAQEFIVTRVGAAAESADKDALNDIVQRCGGLPLALAVVAARASAGSGPQLAGIARELRDAEGRLDAFSGSDMDNALRAIFSLSYRMLSEPAAQMFRLISVHPGPDLTLPALASLIGLPRAQGRALLGELVRTRLMTEQTLGRYQAHDLVKAYAHELSTEGDSDAVRREALDRLFHHYRLSANQATAILEPHRSPKLFRAREGVIGLQSMQTADAVRWLDAERHVLTPVLRQTLKDPAVLQETINDGHTFLAWPTASSVLLFYQMQRYWVDLVAVMTKCLDVVVATGNISGQIRMRRGLAGALNVRGEHVRALQHLDDALRLSIELNDVSQQASCHGNRGEVKAAQGDHRTALEYYEQAIRTFEAAGDEDSCAYLRRCSATSLAWIGEYQRCAEMVAAVLPAREAAGDVVGVGECYEILAFSLGEQGDSEAALASWQRALNLYREVNLWTLTTRCLIGIGDIAWFQRDSAAARRSWNEAGAMLQGSDLSLLRQVQERLNRRPDPL